MKKNNKIKKSVSMHVGIPFRVCAVSVILSSCSDELDIQQSYPFSESGDDACAKTLCVDRPLIRCEVEGGGRKFGSHNLYHPRYFSA